MAEHCFGCHGVEKAKGKLNLEALTSKEAFLAKIKVIQKGRRTRWRITKCRQRTSRSSSDVDRAKLGAFFQQVLDEYLEANTEMAPAPNRHHQSAEGTPITNLWVTMARIMGMDVERIGDSTPRH